MSNNHKLIRLSEHHREQDVSAYLSKVCPRIHFKTNTEPPFCIVCTGSEDTERKLSSEYYVGTDWLKENEVAVYVEPKLNVEDSQVDILQMLVESMSNPDTSMYLHDMFEVKPDKPFITLPHNQDFITPLLMLHFLNVVKTIVRKGLKKSYYSVNENLYCKVKGKVLVAQTIKNNLVKNKQLHTQCQYSEFGINGVENRLLKKALIFTQRYLDTLIVKEKKDNSFQVFLSNTFNYITPAFQAVSPEVELDEVKHCKFNPFFKEYKDGIELARLILKRYGYNINNVKKEEEVKVPPFWIDMTKLFELFVLAQLKKRYKNEVEFQFKAKYGYLDYLVLREREKMVVDAKYKPKWEGKYNPDDIRQLSGYARDVNVTDKLDIAVDQRSTIVPDCLIIYSNQKSKNSNLNELSDLKDDTIDEFVGFYRVGIRLPEVKTT